IGGAGAGVLYATHPQLGYVSALLVGFLLGAEFDVLAFLIKRYYGGVAYGRVYGGIFGVFYFRSRIGINAFARLHDSYGNYHAALYAAAGVLAASAVLLVMMPRYRYAVGADAVASAEPAPQSA